MESKTSFSSYQPAWNLKIGFALVESAFKCRGEKCAFLVHLWPSGQDVGHFLPHVFMNWPKESQPCMHAYAKHSGALLFMASRREVFHFYSYFYFPFDWVGEKCPI